MITNILTMSGYFERFYQIKRKGVTHKEAYEELEAELFDQYGINRYSSFESFQVMFYRYLNFAFKQV